MKKQSGFTLIELLLVLAIIGIISAIAIPALLSQRARARDKSSISNADSVVADLVGQYDRLKEAAIDISDATKFATNAVTATTMPSVSSATNPWFGTGTAPNTAYNPVIATETAVDGTTTKSKCTAANLGQVQMGYLPVVAGANGCVASAVQVNTPFKDNAGVATSAYLKIAGIE